MYRQLIELVGSDNEKSKNPFLQCIAVFYFKLDKVTFDATLTWVIKRNQGKDIEVCILFVCLFVCLFKCLKLPLENKHVTCSAYPLGQH